LATYSGIQVRKTLPHLRAAVTLLASFAAKPTHYHVRCVKRVLKYMHTHARDFIHFAPDPDFDQNKINIACFTDADWSADRTTRRSMSGYLLYMDYNLISSGCKYHPTQCLSTMEAEYMGQAYAAKEICFVTNLLSELNPQISVNLPVQLFGDNNAALKFAEEHSVNDRVKHIDLRHHWLNRLVDTGIISMNYVNTKDNIADILTKPLSTLDFEKFTKFIVGHIQPALKALISQLTHLNVLRHKKL
jgi:hypothetical protein